MKVASYCNAINSRGFDSFIIITPNSLYPNGFSAAGITGAVTVAFTNDHPLNCSSLSGGLVNRTACADPTPGSVYPILQAEVNYSYVSTHPYSGLSCFIPAAITYLFPRLTYAEIPQGVLSNS